jgi:hypothetical protein
LWRERGAGAENPLRFRREGVSPFSRLNDGHLRDESSPQLVGRRSNQPASQLVPIDVAPPAACAPAQPTGAPKAPDMPSLSCPEPRTRDLMWPAQTFAGVVLGNASPHVISFVVAAALAPTFTPAWAEMDVGSAARSPQPMPGWASRIWSGWSWRCRPQRRRRRCGRADDPCPGRRRLPSRAGRARGAQDGEEDGAVVFS